MAAANGHLVSLLTHTVLLGQMWSSVEASSTGGTASIFVKAQQQLTVPITICVMISGLIPQVCLRSHILPVLLNCPAQTPTLKSYQNQAQVLPLPLKLSCNALPGWAEL